MHWNPAVAERAARLAADLAAVPLPELTTALDAELTRRADQFITGIEKYRRHPYRRSVTEPPCIWQDGGTRLLDFGPTGGTPVLVIPSLVNQSYILDLAEGHSMLRALAAGGIRPLLVDWGIPGDAERGFGLTHYVQTRLEAALARVVALTHTRPFVMGYCMGGLLAMALAVRRQSELSGLILLATPWDFGPMSGYAPLLGALATPLTRLFEPLGQLPAEIIHQLFAIADPLQAIRKFSAFGSLDLASDTFQQFVATEDWLNDGVPLAVEVARECLGGWYGANAPANGDWRIAGEPIDPTRFKAPVLIVQPSRDRLVPRASVEALAPVMPAAAWLRPDLGHIGIAISSSAPHTVWQPIATWMAERSAAGLS